MEDLIVKIGKSGKCVIAGASFKVGRKILNFSGPILLRSEIPENIISPEDDRFLQIGKDIYIGPSGEIDDLVNHSCDPNTAVLIEGEKASLVAIKNIKKGDEITYDYSLQMSDEQWTMECYCGSRNCRHTIREYKYLPQVLKDYYLKLGFVPYYNQGK